MIRLLWKLDFQRHKVNIRNSLVHQRKLLLYFLNHQKNTCNLCRIFMEHSGNAPIFSIPGILFGNIPGDSIRNFFRISRKYIMETFHECCANIYFPVRRKLLKAKSTSELSQRLKRLLHFQIISACLFF